MGRMPARRADGAGGDADAGRHHRHHGITADGRILRHLELMTMTNECPINEDARRSIYPYPTQDSAAHRSCIIARLHPWRTVDQLDAVFHDQAMTEVIRQRGSWSVDQSRPCPNTRIFTAASCCRGWQRQPAGQNPVTFAFGAAFLF